MNMTPFLLVKPVEKALQWAFPFSDPTILRISSRQISARVGQQHLPIRVLQAHDGRVKTSILLHLLAKGYGVFLVSGELQEGLLLTFLGRLSFPSPLPEELSWSFLRSQASSQVEIPGYVFEVSREVV